MSASTLNFSATLPPFQHTSGAETSFSNSNISATGKLSLATVTDTTGKPTTTVSSSVVSNGLNYAATNASIQGNLLTVDYVSTNAADSAQNSGVAAGLLSSNISGSGVNFSPQQSTGHGNSVTTVYNTSPNQTFNETIQGAATSTGSSSNDQNVSLKSLALVGNSIIATYQITNGLPDNTTVQAASAPPSASTASVSVTIPSANSGIGASFSNSGVSSIGDVLAASANLAGTNSSVTAPQSSTEAQAADSTNLGSILATSLNPGINFSPSSSLQVADFIDTSASAFPTSAPAPSDTSNNTNTNSNDTSGTGGTNTASNQTTSFNSNSGIGATNTGTAGSALGIYNAVANASASTIRGAGVNTVA